MNASRRALLVVGLAGVMVGAGVLAACEMGTGGPGAPVARPAEVLPPVVAQPTVALAQPTAVPTVAPTAVPAPTATPVPVATPHPLSIAALRKGDFLGSEITIEQTLAPGSNYTQYIASYKSEGLKINALLTIPRGPKPASGWPVIIFNHGFYQPRQYRSNERWVEYTAAFARSGYLVFRPDYRGHGFSEGNARGGYGNDDYVIDVLNATAAARKHPDADPNRVGMWGHSMGGYITLRSMVVDPGIKAGVIWGGVVGSYPDMIYNWGRGLAPTATAGPLTGSVPQTQGSWRNQLVRDYGTPEQNPGFWASISANTYLMDMGGPLQIHHGGADTSVPVRMSQTLDAQMKAAGLSSELFVYPGDDHDISRNLFTALNRSVAFFDKYVKNP